MNSTTIDNKQKTKIKTHQLLLVRDVCFSTGKTATSRSISRNADGHNNNNKGKGICFVTSNDDCCRIALKFFCFFLPFLPSRLFLCIFRLSYNLCADQSGGSITHVGKPELCSVITRPMDWSRNTVVHNQQSPATNVYNTCALWKMENKNARCLSRNFYLTACGFFFFLFLLLLRSFIDFFSLLLQFIFIRVFIFFLYFT